MTSSAAQPAFEVETQPEVIEAPLIIEAEQEITTNCYGVEEYQGSQRGGMV